MLVTPDFVLLNNPRAGSTFARKAVTAAYEFGTRTGASHIKNGASPPVVHELVQPIQRGNGRTGEDHHGTYAQIPPTLRHLPVVSTVRNPFTHLISGFELHLRQQAPSVPSLSPAVLALESYMSKQEDALASRWDLPFDEVNVGPQTIHFFQMFAREPQLALRDLRNGASTDALALHIPEITLLRQERLRDELASYLRPFCSAEQLAIVRQHKPSHVTVRSRPWSREYLSDETVARILSRERILVGLLSHRGIDYTIANADFSLPN